MRRRSIRCPRLTSVLLAVVCCVACSDGFSPIPPAVSVTVDPVPVAAAIDTSAGVVHVRFTLPVTIRNDGPGSVDLHQSCDPPIEYRTSTGWSQAAVGTVCIAMATPPVEISEGTTVVRGVTVDAVIGTGTQPGRPRWIPGTTDGTYRVALTLTFPDGRLLPESSRVSPDFTLAH